MIVFSAINKLIKKRRKKFRYEVIKLTVKEKTALATIGGSLVTMMLVLTIIWVIN